MNQRNLIEEEKVSNLFKMLQSESERRKKLFADYGGDYSSYIKMSGQKLPSIVIAIHNFAAFTEMYEEKEEAVQFANESLIRDILGFLDNMDRALAAAKNGGDLNALVEGFSMTQNQLLSTLDKNWGLKEIESVGKEFDPSLHEACMMTVDESLEKETVLEEFQKGYTLHDRVIRPSKVKIGKPE